MPILRTMITPPLVTQASQQLARKFDLVSTPTQQRNKNHLGEEFLLDFQEDEHILEYANLETTPIMEPSTVPHFPLPTNLSHDTSTKKRILCHSMINSSATAADAPERTFRDCSLTV